MFASHFVFRLFAVVMTHAGVSCTSSDEPHGGAKPSLATSPRGIACTALAESLCARVESCAPFLAKTATGIGAACTSAMFEHCVRTAGLGGSNRSIADIASCAEGVRTTDCSGFLTRFPDVCDFPKGSLVDGSLCSFHEQCASRFCDREQDTACGICARAPLVGEPCLHEACAAGLACNSGHTCARPGGLGEVCGPNQPCGPLVFCDNNRCAVRKLLGEGCEGFGQCDPFAETTCAVNSVCRATPIVELGEACSLSLSQFALCRAPARCIDGRCAPAKAEGASCGAAGAHECDGFQSECIRGRCLLRSVETCQK